MPMKQIETVLTLPKIFTASSPEALGDLEISLRMLFKDRLIVVEVLGYSSSAKEFVGVAYNPSSMPDEETLAELLQNENIVINKAA